MIRTQLQSNFRKIETKYFSLSLYPLTVILTLWRILLCLYLLNLPPWHWWEISTGMDGIFFSKIRTLILVLMKGFSMWNNLPFSGLLENSHILIASFQWTLSLEFLRLYYINDNVKITFLIVKDRRRN